MNSYPLHHQGSPVLNDESHTTGHTFYKWSLLPRLFPRNCTQHESWASERRSAGQDAVRSEEQSLSNRGPLLGRGQQGAPGRSDGDGPQQEAAPAQGCEGGAVGNWSVVTEGCGPCHRPGLRRSNEGPRGVSPQLLLPTQTCCWCLPLDEPVQSL